MDNLESSLNEVVYFLNEKGFSHAECPDSIYSEFCKARPEILMSEELFKSLLNAHRLLYKTSDNSQE